MRIITLEDLHIFQTVVREGGVIRAAETLNRVPSNVTTRIKRFEERLGHALFQRKGRQLVLTEAGQKLLGHASDLLRMADDIEQDMTASETLGPLRIGSLESAAAVRLPACFASFYSRFPDISIELSTGSTGALLKRLHNHDLEAAFVSEPFDASGLNTRICFEEELVLISAQGHPAIRTPDDLRNSSVAVFPHGCSYRRCLLEWLAAGHVEPTKIMDLGSYHAIVACVSAGAAVGIMPASVLSSATLGEHVMQHAFPSQYARNHTHLVWKGHMSWGLRQLIGMLDADAGT